MLLRTLRARLRRGREEEALRLLRETVEAQAETPGLAAIYLARRLEDDVQHVKIVSVWRDAEALASAFGRGWQTAHLPGALGELVEAAEVDHMETIVDRVTDGR